MGQVNENKFTIKDDGTIVRNPKVEKMKEKLNGGSSGGKVWIILLLAAIGIISFFLFNQEDRKPAEPIEDAQIEVKKETEDAPMEEAEEASMEETEVASMEENFQDANGIEFKYANPSASELDEWKRTNSSRCADLIEEIGGDYNIPQIMIDEDPCLVYLILTAKSLNQEEKQSWFEIYSMMNDEQKDKLYDILYREKGKLAGIERKYEKKQKEIQRKREELIEKYKD